MKEISRYNLDFELIRSKSKYFYITQNSRLWASLKLSRLEKVYKFLTISGFFGIKEVFKEFVDYLTSVTNKDFNSDDNVAYLVIAMKNCNISEINELAFCFGKLAIKKNLEYEYTQKRLNSWLYEEREHTINGSKDQFYLEFRNQVKNIISKFNSSNLKNCNQNLTFEQFIKEPALWGTSGSMFGTNLSKEMKENVNKTKWSVALTKDIKSYIEDVNEDIKEGKMYYKVMTKSEPTNARLVVVADNSSYLVESYLAYYFEQCITEESGLFNYFSNNSKLKAWDKRRLKFFYNKWILDLDYSGWDEGMTLMMQTIIIEELENWFNLVGLNTNSDKNRLFEYLKNGIKNGYILEDIKYKNSVFKRIINGLCSGKRFTTFLNSVSNMAVSRMACDAVDINVSEDTIYVLGDDVDEVLNSKQECIDIMNVLDSMNFSINRLKSKFSNLNGEFLKINYNKLGVYQSPLRIIRSILYSVDEEIDKYSGVMARIDNWAKFIGRSRSWILCTKRSDTLDYKTIFDTMIYDFWHVFGNSHSKEIISNWLCSTSILKGGGFPIKFNNSKYNNVALEVKKVIRNGNANEQLVLSEIKQSRKGLLNDQLLRNTDLSSLAGIIIKGSNSIDFDFETKRLRQSNDIMRLLIGIGEYNISEANPYQREFRRNYYIPDGSGIYTASMLKGKHNIRDIFKELKNNNNVIYDIQRNAFLKDSLIDRNYVQYLYNIRKRYNMKILQDMLNNDWELSQPRELVFFSGETAGAMAWLVLKPLIMNYFSTISITTMLISCMYTIGVWMRSNYFSNYVYNKNSTNIILSGTTYDKHKRSVNRVSTIRIIGNSSM